MPQGSLQGVFGSDVDPLDLMRAEDDGMRSATVALMDRTLAALPSVEALAANNPYADTAKVLRMYRQDLRDEAQGYEDGRTGGQR